MTRLTFTLIFLFITTLSFSQHRKKRIQQRFKAGLIVGANLAQINGDLFTGYDKLGLQFGARGVMVLSPTLEASMELLYAQKGSKQSNETRKTAGQRAINIHLNYAETPILLNFLRKENEDEGFFRRHWHVGLSYSRLLNAKVETEPIFDPETEVNYVALVPFFNNNDVAVIGGLTYYLSKHIGVTLRHTISIKSMYKSKEEDPTNQLGKWHSFFLTGQVIYIF